MRLGLDSHGVGSISKVMGQRECSSVHAKVGAKKL